MVIINSPRILNINWCIKEKNYAKNTFNYYVKDHFAVVTLDLTKARRTEALQQGLAMLKINNKCHWMVCKINVKVKKYL